MMKDSLTQSWLNAATAQLDKQKLSKEQDDAIVQLFEVCSTEPERAFQVICEVLASDPRMDLVGYLGAGPLEDLLVNHCEYIDIVIEEAKSAKLLKECLEQVNLEAEDCADAQKIHDFLERYRR